MEKALLPLLADAISAPNLLHKESDVMPVYASILQSAIRGMWKQVGRYEHVTAEVLLSQNAAVLDRQDEIQQTIDEMAANNRASVQHLEGLAQSVVRMAQYAHSVWQTTYDRLVDSAPPVAHEFDQHTYSNPFLLARAEDFNHNYEKLARLFEDSPEWDAIQRRTENVFIEGGRGTGKSMLLRRLTAQATVAAYRLSDPKATFDDISEDYFGVYVKFTRGYYEQLQPSDSVSTAVSSLLAQHELNIEIFDAFASTLSWLKAHRALPSLDDTLHLLMADLQSLFNKAPEVSSLEDLRRKTIKFEQNEILSYYRDITFLVPHSYKGSARETVTFIRELSTMFRQHLCRDKEMRLFLLIDEFESLLDEQQIALNTVMKMRLPDVAIKVGVRRSGRKTSATFTARDPIQKPRDYTVVPLDYDINKPAYRSLLEGISRRRLLDAGYPSVEIHDYLVRQPTSEETDSGDVERELQKLWVSGNRRPETQLDDEFRTKYTTAAVYRVHATRNARKSFAGFERYVLLSSGTVSNFIELCKYTFYLALSDQLPLKHKPQIPTYVQNDAIYLVSQRLFQAIEANVEMVGAALVQLLTDLGSLLRHRLLNHPSEPEANRISIVDYDHLDAPEYESLRQVIDSAAIWSVLHIESAAEAFQTKNASRPRTAEAIINRIYCPALGISPRARWRVLVTVKDLADLLSFHSRQTAYRRLRESIGWVSGVDIRQMKIFDSGDASEHTATLPD